MLDRQALLQPLVGAACASQPSSPAGLERRAHEAARRQRQVVQSLRQVCQQVQWGQPWLACVASVAPFLGLLGTVWGLLDAMTTLPDASTGAWEAWVPALSHTLQLTAVGLCVAVPAVMAHHLMANRLNMLQQSLEDFAADLIEHLHSGQDA
jgi:biopolymer transport protein ExbB